MSMPVPLRLNGADILADISGALFWPERRLLAVADLHLEKGSGFASRGRLLPPYDTAATLLALSAAIQRHDPSVVVCLGDSFHDREAAVRLGRGDRATLSRLTKERDWIWIAGNHDPDPADNIGGRFADTLAIGALTFRHEPALAGESDGEVAGHLHPLARIARRGRAVSRRCFAGDGRRLVLPAFGAYAGGLNVRDRAFTALFGALSFTAHMLGEDRLYAMPAERCLAD